MVSAGVRREQVACVQRHGVSLRRACALLSVARSTMGYESKIELREVPIVAAMRELSAQHPRFGYRRILDAMPLLLLLLGLAYRDRPTWILRAFVVFGIVVHAYGIYVINVLGFV